MRDSDSPFADPRAPRECRIVVFGSGGHGKVVADAATASGLLPVAFVDDNPVRDGNEFFSLPVVGWDRFCRERVAWKDTLFALGIGDNRARERAVTRLAATGLCLTSVVHPAATIARSAVLGAGTVVMAGAVVNPSARVGEAAIINTGAVVEHDCVLESFVHLSPNAAIGGGVRIGARSHLGLGVVVRPGTRIGADVIVGAGAAVVSDVPDGMTVVGVPARPLANRSRGECK